ncbi:MAG TPA: adenosyl-hopene transferase HpnH [Alphaproteobacteria bacterium]|nr:adenosyl-hopene transferase HpnH [Alphaproteobacteria bacterium]
MSIPIIQQVRVGSYIMKQRLKGVKKYPLVLMLEPLFRCNLACSGCGKIDYPDEILNKRLSLKECLDAVDECGAPIVSIPGGEPLLHKEMGEIVAGIVARKKFVYLCTNALLLEKKMDLFKPSPYLTFSIHLDGLKEEHDKSVCQDGVFDRCVSAIKEAKKRGFRVNVNCTLFNNANPERVIAFFDWCKQEKIDGITVSPGYAYERAPDQGHFLNRLQTKELFRNVLKDSKKKKWDFSQSMMFLDFLAGNQSYHCTPWSNPTRNVFGWQRPCYLLGEGYAESFKELMSTTNWDSYGTGNYEKCADCMVHCGYEGSAINDTLDNPLKVVKVKLFGIKTKGKMAKEIDLSKQRKADWLFDKQVETFLSDVHLTTPAKSKTAESKVRAKEPSNIV